ncbi:hypothetical protein, partial [Proteus faecis]|uniref:hypothetical protein n=1 Tax=Proteus faecis TaxID=2050967 RepID=UPI003075E09D
MSSIKDGTSNTIALGEVNSNGFKNGGVVGGAGVPRDGGGEAVFRMWAHAHTHSVIMKDPNYALKVLDNTDASTLTSEFWRT